MTTGQPPEFIIVFVWRLTNETLATRFVSMTLRTVSTGTGATETKSFQSANVEWRLHCPLLLFDIPTCLAQLQYCFVFVQYQPIRFVFCLPSCSFLFVLMIAAAGGLDLFDKFFVGVPLHDFFILTICFLTLRSCSIRYCFLFLFVNVFINIFIIFVFWICHYCYHDVLGIVVVVVILRLLLCGVVLLILLVLLLVADGIILTMALCV
mmetsp:Transcript_34225/g.78935  ORF Transcript_34225/g.78935 Transcript_34225/m.78935 type:complete len:208 (-) Transcript_34225:507-1130(-)